MYFASYSLRPIFGILWAWEVEFDGARSRRGYAPGKRAARWCARNAIRRSRPPLDRAGDEDLVERRKTSEEVLVDRRRAPAEEVVVERRR